MIQEHYLVNFMEITDIKTNYHTHYSICKHAVGSLEEYILKAIELGYEEFAVTEHIPFPKEMRSVITSKRMWIEELDTYINEVNHCKEKYKNQIKILLGFECEYLDFLEPLIKELHEKSDFLILGQHYLKVGNKYKSIYDVSEDKDLQNYISTAHRALSTGLFKIIAHPEIFLWKIKTWNSYIEELSNQLIDTAIKNNVLLEINSNGIRLCSRKNRTFIYNNKKQYCYPNYNFFKLAKEKNAKIILNDDSHDPSHIKDQATIEALSLANNLQIKLIKHISLEEAEK